MRVIDQINQAIIALEYFLIVHALLAALNLADLVLYFLIVLHPWLLDGLVLIRI